MMMLEITIVYKHEPIAPLRNNNKSETDFDQSQEIQRFGCYSSDTPGFAPHHGDPALMHQTAGRTPADGHSTRPRCSSQPPGSHRDCKHCSWPAVTDPEPTDTIFGGFLIEPTAKNSGRVQSLAKSVGYPAVFVAINHFTRF